MANYWENSLRPLLLIVATVAFLSAVPVHAQKMPVHIEATAKDDVGSRLAYAFKEAVRRSAAMTLVDDDADARIGVRFVTINPDEGRGTQSQTIYSVVVTAQTFHDTPVTMYMSNYVGYCGSSRVNSCAESLTAATDEQASKVRNWIRQATKGRN